MVMARKLLLPLLAAVAFASPPLRPTRTVPRRLGSLRGLPRSASVHATRRGEIPMVRRVTEALGQAGASAALAFAMMAGSAFGPGHQAFALDEGLKELQMEALRTMTKDAVSKGYDQKWIDDHVSQMEERGYDMDFVKEHLGMVVDEVKTKSEVSSDNMMYKNLDKGTAPEDLTKKRVVSSIPRTNSDGLPSHQEGMDGIDNWVYPSPTMFWNAMDRKGKHPERYKPDDIAGVVRIHNYVNEKGWNEVMKWEDMHRDECPKGPTLTSFKGKYDQLSGKGILNKYIPGMLGAPFDRHDWLINRCGKPVRYILDYYKDPTVPEEPKIRLETRPAPDSIEALADWARFQSWRSNHDAKMVNFEEVTNMKTADQVMSELATK